MYDPVTVTIDSGRVTVNDVLVAEVAVGQVTGRDDLARDLALHRIAGQVHRILDEVTCHVADLTDERAETFGAGLVDGLRGRTDPHPMTGPGGPGVPRRLADGDFRDGHQAGTSLVAMHRHLAATNDATATGEGAGR